MLSLIDTVLFISFIALLIFFYYKHSFNYWSRLGVSGVKPKFPYGNIQGQFSPVNSQLQKILT